MPQIQAIKRKSEGYGNIAQLAGTVAGGIVGSIVPGVGTLAGAGLGGTLGGAAGGAVDNSQSLGMQPIPQGQSGGGAEMAAMSRKQQQMGQDNLAVLQNAETHLPSLPEDLRQQYAPAIVQARMLEQQRRGMA